MIVSVVMGLLAPLTIVAGASPVAGAALMALMAIMVGRMSRFGLQKSALLAPVMLAWTLITPPTWDGQSLVDRTDNAYLLWMAAIFFVGAIIPALIVPRLLRTRPLPGPVPHSRAEAMPYTVIVTVLATVSTYYVFMVPATASLNATTLSQVGQLGEQRMVDNVVGGLLVLIAVAAAAGYSHWASRHGRTDDRDEEATAAAEALPSLT